MQDGAGDDDGTAAEHVGEPAGRQLQRHHEHAVHGEQDADLGQGEAARLGEEHGDRGGEADRQPAQGGEPDQAPGGRTDGLRRAHGGHSVSGTRSVNTKTSSAPSAGRSAGILAASSGRGRR